MTEIQTPASIIDWTEHTVTWNGSTVTAPARTEGMDPLAESIFQAAMEYEGTRQALADSLHGLRRAAERNLDQLIAGNQPTGSVDGYSRDVAQYTERLAAQGRSLTGLIWVHGKQQVVSSVLGD